MLGNSRVPASLCVETPASCLSVAVLRTAQCMCLCLLRPTCLVGLLNHSCAHSLSLRTSASAQSRRLQCRPHVYLCVRQVPTSLWGQSQQRGRGKSLEESWERVRERIPEREERGREGEVGNGCGCHKGSVGARQRVKTIPNVCVCRIPTYVTHVCAYSTNTRYVCAHSTYVTHVCAY